MDSALSTVDSPLVETREAPDSAPASHARRVQAARPPGNDEASHRFSDAERYAWIRGNRGNFLIFEALSRANFDSDFDALIDNAMRSQLAGRHIPAMPVVLAPRRRRSDWD
jgi:hypothetical protein